MSAMHKVTADDIAAANELLSVHELHVAALNTATPTDQQLMDALRNRDSVRGWIYTAEKYGETRIALKDLPRVEA